jgi:hypothetical protein
MSSRINELAIQAGGVWRGGYVEQPNGDSVWTDRKFVVDVDTEQFAKLIVQECITVARGADGMDATHEAWYLIEQHFEVDVMSTEDKKTLIKELLGVKND